MNQSVKNVLIMSIVISDEYGKRVDYGKYKIYYVHGRTDEERQFIVFPERRKKCLHSNREYERNLLYERSHGKYKAVGFLSQNHVIVHFFNYYEGYSGTFYPKNQYNSGRLIVKQVQAYDNSREVIAKAIVCGIGRNIYEVLYHYYKHDKKEVKEVLDWIRREFYVKVENAQNVKEIMAAEGEVWMRFYGTFRYFLPEDFVMNKRVKRPPDNPINALISYGNTLLYTKTISAIYQTHLDQRISFLHEPSEGRFSLSLDMSEVFKPVIVYRTIFDLVNNRKLQVEKHFDKKVNYCLLNEEGRKIFIEAFEARMESVFVHDRLKRKVTYRTALKLDCYKLIKYILEGQEFIPFSLKDNR